MAEMFEASKLETPNLPDARMSPTTANQISLKKSSFAMLNSMNSFDVADSGKTLDDIYNRDFRVSRLKNARGSMQARITTSAKKTGLRAQLASLGLSVMGFFLSIKPWFKFMFSLLQEISYSVVANPSMFLTCMPYIEYMLIEISAPTNFLILVFGLPHAGAALLVLAPLLYLLLHNRWLINIYNKLSSEQGNLSLINWSDPEMYSNQHDDLIRRAKKTMCMNVG
ncbi:hypothetical protein NEOLI_003357 [Neolecta irregularis DAH-3]|uniref:Uncharacterized protein n=1 Tax=Neolecta irregularis (strain DAH-3) TaxID=1198029 RepID=A0A1U7LMZ7_NEOID|nr:hypothetical protein NEOLI_003357 [Neolecta irregularis DAH-3]|eukprot:OLL24017.1 hypothetical protein NEOLI_003357 [Neolecta irregularis DAH-3]